MLLQNDLPFAMPPNELMLQTDPTAETIQVLPESVQAVDRVLVCLSGAASELCAFAHSSWTTEEPL